MIRNKATYILARKYRKKGESYLDISQKLNIPKSTLSCWFSKKSWSKKIRNQLTLINQAQSSNFFAKLGRLKRLETAKRYELFRKEAQEEYRTLKKNALFLSGISIYWGEGEKTDNGRVGLINSDDRMIQTVANFYRKVLKIPENKLRAALFIYRDNNLDKCLKYWLSKTGVAKKQFIKTQILPSRSKITKRKVKNGICNVYFTDVKMNIKIREWIRLLSVDMRA